MKSMKKKGTMKRRKAMKVSKIAKGKRAKSLFSWSQGQDIGGIEEAGSHQKQVGKSRIQKMSDRAKLAFKKKRIGQVECRMSKGAKRFETQRIRSYWWQNVAG